MTFRQFAFNNVARNKRVYVGHFLSSTFAVIIFFTFGLIAFHPAMEGNISEYSSAINALGKGSFQVSQYIIYIFSIFFILYSVSSFLKKRKREFGILMILGMSPRQFNRLVFYENIIIGFVSTITGIGLGLIFSKLILLISASVLTLEKGLPFYFPAKAMIMTGVGFMLLFILISLFTSKTVRVTKLVELIKSEEKPKPAPRASILLSFLGVILIGAGYALVFYFAQNHNEMSSVDLVSYLTAVVGLVVLGTYFFFTQLSVYVLKAIKQKDRLFFKKTNILSVSELVYRIKDNAVTFFIVAVISAVAFTAIGTSLAVGDVLLKDLDQTYAIQYYSFSENKQEKQHISRIEQELKQEEIPYTLVELEVLNSRYSVIKLSDYNKYAKKLDYNPIELKNEHDAVLIKGSASKEAPKKEAPKKEAPKKGESVQLQEGLNKVILKNVVLNDYFSKFLSFYVVPDSLFSEMLAALPVTEENNSSVQQRFGFIVDDWKETKELATKLHEELYNPNQTDYYVNFISVQWQFMKQLNGIFSILTVLVGIVFFVFASSFLYFRLFTDLEKDQEKYRMLSKLGLSKKELNKVVTREMSVLFFLPFIVATIHSSVAYFALQKLVEAEMGPVVLTQNLVFVLVSFLSFHLVYFFIMRMSYLKQLYRAIC